MPTITRQQLDEIVDANVTDKTAPLSLTPQQEGFAIKKVADYVDDNKQDLSQKSQDISEDAESVDKYPSTKAVADYVQANMTSLPYKESAVKLFQSGTNDPQESNYYIDEVRISPNNNTNPLFRGFIFNRTDVGEYNVQILWYTGSASAINITKIDISSSDAKIRFGTTSNGSIGPFSYYQQNFQVYSPDGTLSDNILASTNMYFRLFN
jgi:hypothetical protein